MCVGGGGGGRYSLLIKCYGFNYSLHNDATFNCDWKARVINLIVNYSLPSTITQKFVSNG